MRCREHLVESELFGAARGAYTGALHDRPGKVHEAEGGTLFLDEIAELSLESQATLLQLLDRKEYYELGSNLLRKADVRVMAATNKDLSHCVGEGRFREDLYYRLDVMSIELPSLAQRRDDIRLLAEHFCRDVCVRHDWPQIGFTRWALCAAELADWPGNVRQLCHSVEKAVVAARMQGAREITEHHLFPKPGAHEAGEPLTYHAAIRRRKRHVVRAALERHAWNVTVAACDLGIQRSYLNTLVRRCDLARPPLLRAVR